MREEKFEQPNILEENTETTKPEATKLKLAEGLDKDPRLEIIKNELVEDWKQTTGKDILSAEGQDFQFGDSTAWKRWEEPITLEQRAQRVFAERFPEDAQAYVEKEKNKDIRESG